MEEASNVLFSIGPIEITGVVVTMWVIIAILVGGSFFGVAGMFFGVPVCAGSRQAAQLFLGHTWRKAYRQVFPRACDTVYFYHCEQLLRSAARRGTL